MDDLLSRGIEIATQPWKTRAGWTVPESTDLALAKNEGVYLDATYLYADLGDSTKLAQACTAEDAGKVIRMFLSYASSCIKANGGAIRSFDGDRVMGIFVGKDQCGEAVRAALNLDYAVNILMDMFIEKSLPDVAAVWKTRHCTGIDRGQALLTRGGVRLDNDLVSIGLAPNLAAKLSDKRDFPYCTYVTSRVLNPLSYSDCQVDGDWIWRSVGEQVVGDAVVNLWKTEKWRKPA
ncbi:adenylate/guanylate cyclase domain-containing protein [Aquipuribacter sp. MA13-6]|uniref:adenylate/guanylate cyclase domain-containing protein n=1 Tax=unclassified Aquipuribacter TaxID=2635084 RepID=UPI003EEF8405